MAVAQPPRALLRLLGFACLVSGKDPPCPEDATVMSCSDWCRTVYPGSRATMSGSSCARLSAQDMKRGMGPACICYDSGYEKELKSCRSKCPVEEDPAEASGDDGEVGCFGSTGRDTCRADQLTDESERYLLYDVKPGEGFNLQREVFPRVGWIVAQLNAARCSGDRCPRWSLVLPPWCRLAHWRRASEEHVAWEKFFDAKALRSTNVTVLEFHEFVARAGGPKVDLVISSTTERQSRNQMMSKPRKSGGFYGFTRTPQQCFSGGRGGLKPPRQEWMAEELRWRVTYSGNCAEGVAAIDHRCAVLADSSARDWVDLVQASMREGARSVLLKAADAVSPPSKEELDRLGLREAMLFAKPIRDVGERYMQEVLQSKPFLAVHCRRTDFLRAREATTPSLEALAEQVELALADFGLQQVYIATDAPDDLREVLRSQVRTGRIFFLEDLDLGADARLEGELAAIEMWIAARATAFIGTQESRFTMHIQIDRSWLGKSFETSNRELCKSLASRRCLSPYYKSMGRRGSQHKDYWEPPGSAASSA